MMSKSADCPIRVMLVCEDSEVADRLRGSLSGFQLDAATRAESAARFLSADVLLVSAPVLPDLPWADERRPAVIWMAPDSADGPADLIMPADAEAEQLERCIDLMGRRVQLVREIGEFDRQIAELSGRPRWRAGGLWKLRDELSRGALIDPLTGVFNRRHLEHLLPTMFERCRATGVPLSVLLLDLDRFKPVNTQFGHRAGDQVLREVARRLELATRESDVVCRYGGDEIAVIAFGADATAAQRLAERLRSTVSGPAYIVDQQPVSLSCCVGAAVAPDDSPNSPEELLHFADLAMLAAKRAGGDRVCLWRDSVGDPPKPVAPA